MSGARGSASPGGPLTLALVATTVFGFATTVTMLGPLLLAISREFAVPVGTAGLLATATAVPWAFGSPITGLVSDRVGRRPLIILALTGMGVCSLLSGAAPSFAALVVVRLCAGVCGAFGPPSLLAAVGDLFPPARRAGAMGWFNMGFGLAAIVGVPAIALVGGWLGWRAAFLGLGTMLLGLAALVRVAFPADRRDHGRRDSPASYRTVLAERGLLPMLSANLLERMLLFMTTLYLPSFLMQAYALDMVHVAPALSLIAVGAIAGNLAGGWAGDRTERLGVFAGAELAAGLVAVGLFWLHPGLGLSVLLAVAFGLANATGRPGMLAYGSEMLPAQRGAVLGLVGLTNQGGMTFGSALGGLLVDTQGYVALGLAIGACGVLAALLAGRVAAVRSDTGRRP